MPLVLSRVHPRPAFLAVVQSTTVLYISCHSLKLVKAVPVVLTTSDILLSNRGSKRVCAIVATIAYLPVCPAAKAPTTPTSLSSSLTTTTASRMSTTQSEQHKGKGAANSLPDLRPLNPLETFKRENQQARRKSKPQDQPPCRHHIDIHIRLQKLTHPQTRLSSPPRYLVPVHEHAPCASTALRLSATERGKRRDFPVVGQATAAS